MEDEEIKNEDSTIFTMNSPGLKHRDEFENI